MDLLHLVETLDGLVRANGMPWYGPVLRRENNDVLRRPLDCKVVGRRGRGRPKMAWRR